MYDDEIIILIPRMERANLTVDRSGSASLEGAADMVIIATSAQLPFEYGAPLIVRYLTSISNSHFPLRGASHGQRSECS